MHLRVSWLPIHSKVIISNCERVFYVFFVRLIKLVLTLNFFGTLTQLMLAQNEVQGELVTKRP